MAFPAALGLCLDTLAHRQWHAGVSVLFADIGEGLILVQQQCA